MKKTIKIFFIVLFNLLILACLNKVLAATASITDSKTVTVGETVNVSASVTAGAWTLELSGNEKTVQFVGSSFADGKADNVTKSSDSISFTPTSTGTYTFKLTGTIDDFNTEEKSTINKTCTITVVQPEPEKQPEVSASTTPEPEPEQTAPTTTTTTKSEQTQEKTKSTNNYLKTLTVSEGDLSPEFYRRTADYTVEFEADFNIKELSKITIYASAEDGNAKVSGTGEKELVDGENNFQITCTAENGSVRTYNIKIVKPMPLIQSDLALSMLEVNTIDKDGKFTKATLDPVFSKDVFEYKLSVSKDIKSLDIDTKVEKDGIIVTIEGAENLNSGKNEVKIILTTEDDKELKTTYIISVEKEEEKILVEEQPEGFMGWMSRIGYMNAFLIIGGIILVLIIVLVVLIIINHRKKKREEFDDYEEDEYIDQDINEEDNEYVESIEKDENFEAYDNLSDEDYNYMKMKELADLHKRNEENNFDLSGKDNFFTNDEKEEEKLGINKEFISYKETPVDAKELKKLYKKNKKEHKRMKDYDSEEKESKRKKSKGKHF